MLYVLLIVLASHHASVLAFSAPYYKLGNATQYFEDFIQKYDVHYADEQEKEARFKIFKDNLIDVNRLNAESSTRRAGEASAVFGITQFMDLTPAEFGNKYTGVGDMSMAQSNCAVLSDQDIPFVITPDSFDWRDQGVVSRVKLLGYQQIKNVKHQGDCLSCYAFSVTGYLESQSAIRKKRLVELSEQQIVDCDKRSYGCSTGFMSNAFMSIIEQGGIMTEDDYPYTGKDGQCKMDPSRAAVTVDRCNTYQLRSQEKLKQLLYGLGPIPIAVSANNFQKYNGGVFNDQQCQGAINHDVLLVGYGTDPIYGPYWTAKDTHGTFFGEGGYIRMQRGEGAHSCGLMNEFMATASII